MDLSMLNCLSKAPKKKYIKKLIDYSISINNRQNSINSLYTTPVSQSFSSDLQISEEDSHSLIQSILQFISLCVSYKFQMDRISEVVGDIIDNQVKQLLIQVVCTMDGQVLETQQKKMKSGNELLGLNWKLQSQIANQKGKSTNSIIQIQLTVKNKKNVQQVKFQMKGQQFQVFFQNLSKIKETLTQLIKE